MFEFDDDDKEFERTVLIPRFMPKMREFSHLWKVGSTTLPNYKQFCQKSWEELSGIMIPIRIPNEVLLTQKFWRKVLTDLKTKLECPNDPEYFPFFDHVQFVLGEAKTLDEKLAACKEAIDIVDLFIGGREFELEHRIKVEQAKLDRARAAQASTSAKPPSSVEEIKKQTVKKGEDVKLDRHRAPEASTSAKSPNPAVKNVKQQINPKEKVDAKLAKEKPCSSATNIVSAELHKLQLKEEKKAKLPNEDDHVVESKIIALIKAVKDCECLWKVNNQGEFLNDIDLFTSSWGKVAKIVDDNKDSEAVVVKLWRSLMRQYLASHNGQRKNFKYYEAMNFLEDQTIVSDIVSPQTKFGCSLEMIIAAYDDIISMTNRTIAKRGGNVFELRPTEIPGYQASTDVFRITRYRTDNENSGYLQEMKKLV